MGALKGVYDSLVLITMADVSEKMVRRAESGETRETDGKCCFGLCATSDDSRMHWLEYIKGELALPASKENGGAVFEEILELCLSSVKKADMSILAARVGTLSVLWGINVSESMVESRLMALVSQWKTRGDRLSFFLSCVICLLATSDKTQEKVVESLMKEYVVPVINGEADRVMAKMSGEVVEEEESDVSDDAPSVDEYIVEFLEAWQVCVALVEKAVAVEMMKDIISSLIGLFDHEADVVRIGASQCVLTIVDLAERYDVEERFEEDFVEAEKTISRVAYDHDVEWSGEEGKTRKAFEAMGELIKERISVVTVDLVTISGAPSRYSTVKGSDFRHYEANANRKGHPVAGYADAAIIQYFASHLGHHFTDLFSVHNIHQHRRNNRTYNAMHYFLTRHPASRSAATHIDAIHQYGDGTFVASRGYLNALESRRRRHRKVRVADYL